MKLRLVLSALLISTLGLQGFAGTISVTGSNSTVTPTVETLENGTNVYHDRSPGHRLVNIPEEFDGDASVIVTSNSDKTKADFSLEVTTEGLGILYIALDKRHAESHPLPWMQDTGITGLPTIFHDTGVEVDIDEGSTFENAGDDINQQFNLWATFAPPGTYNLLNQEFGGGSNNYVVIYDNKLVPEPNSLVLLLLGVAGIAAKVRRRK